jgi:hypothetical protein
MSAGKIGLVCTWRIIHPRKAQKLVKVGTKKLCEAPLAWQEIKAEFSDAEISLSAAASISGTCSCRSRTEYDRAEGCEIAMEKSVPGRNDPFFT